MPSIDGGGLVGFYAGPPGVSTWSDTRISGTAFSMDPVIAAS